MNYVISKCSMSIIYLLIIASIATKQADAEPQLKMLNVVFRHGDRTPDPNNEMFPNDAYVNDSFYPVGRGQLINNGKKREFELGQALRERYDHFLGKFYEPNAIDARSTDYDRTKMSLQLVLSGLYPPQSIQRWNYGLDWQPIPTKYSERIDDILQIPEECPKYLNEYYRIQETPEVKKKLEEFSHFMYFLTEMTNKSITNSLDMYYLYHTFAAEEAMGLDLPSWASPMYPYGRLWDGILLEYEIANYNTLLKRLNGGTLVRKFTEDMLKATKNATSSNPKLFLYSGHETNIASVLNTLDVFEPHVPEYSSAVIIELLKEHKNYYVKVLYYLGIPAVITELRLPGCAVLCPLEQYLEITKYIIPSDEDLICDKSETPAYADARTNIIDEEKYNIIKTFKST